MTGALSLHALERFPLVEPGDDLCELIIAALADNELSLRSGDALVLAQKIVSKAEGRYANFEDVIPGDRAFELAEQANKDPRLVELILSEARDVVRVRPGVIIVEHRNGYIMANAGIDRSNIETSEQSPRALLLPEAPDASARSLRDSLKARLGVDVGVVINDSVGRAWRMGTVGMTLGCAGFPPLFNQMGEQDLFGNVLEVTESAVADELSAAASLVMGQAAEGCPVVVARGVDALVSMAKPDATSEALIRPRDMDMFR